MGRIPALFLILLLGSSPAWADEIKPEPADTRPTPDQYWSEVRRIAREAFGGVDVELELDTGYTHYFEQGTDYPGNSVQVGFKWPVYSKKEKRLKRNDAVKFQQAGAKLIADLEKAQISRNLLRAELPFLKMRREDGMDSAMLYMDVLQKIAAEVAAETMAHRQLQALIKPFSGVALIKSQKPKIKGK